MHLPDCLRRSAARIRILMVAAAMGATIQAGAATDTLQHGPFEIVATGRRISSGTFPNQGGNPFATLEVSSYSLRWRGREVDVPGLGTRFWRVLRLTDAPRPTLLLVTRDFTLVSEKDGQLQVQPVGSGSNTLAEAQWLDSRAGQPGESLMWGIEKSDVASGSELRGGRWLRLGSLRVLDVKTMVLHKIEPWVPMRPGEPVTSVSREGDEARAFSLGGTQYVLAGSQYDYARGRGHVHGLLLVDIASGKAAELRLDRRRMPFAQVADIDAAWIAHYFVWQRDAAGRETLLPRPGAARKPWLGRLAMDSSGTLEYRVDRVRPALLDELRRVVLALPGAALAPDWIDPARGIDGNTLRVGDCVLSLLASGDSPPDEDYGGVVSVYAPSLKRAAQASCNALIRRIASTFDAELAAGRHERLAVLD
ncbi:hypothetical protein [Ideonella sp. A 288]|uniref:hypothetical protein n=1 Tax=Ideonella sp. A 288 TaxID=1962181 RepID=UPI0011851F88|nr:hypothetical protein [Ideonella sp. A 288]